MKCIVIKPFARMTESNGFDAFTHGDAVDIPDAAEAQRMAAAGIITIVQEEQAPETTELQVPGIERAVRPGKKGARHD